MLRLPERTNVLEVRVTTHAAWQASARCGETSVRKARRKIAREVAMAIEAGRYSLLKPSWARKTKRGSVAGLYAWDERKRRCYALAQQDVPSQPKLIVKTVMLGRAVAPQTLGRRKQSIG